MDFDDELAFDTEEEDGQEESETIGGNSNPNVHDTSEGDEEQHARFVQSFVPTAISEIKENDLEPGEIEESTQNITRDIEDEGWLMLEDMEATSLTTTGTKTENPEPSLEEQELEASVCDVGDISVASKKHRKKKKKKEHGEDLKDKSKSHKKKSKSKKHHHRRRSSERKTKSKSLSEEKLPLISSNTSSEHKHNKKDRRDRSRKRKHNSQSPSRDRRRGESDYQQRENDKRKYEKRDRRHKERSLSIENRKKLNHKEDDVRHRRTSSSSRSSHAHRSDRSRSSRKHERHRTSAKSPDRKRHRRHSQRSESLKSDQEQLDTSLTSSLVLIDVSPVTVASSVDEAIEEVAVSVSNQEPSHMQVLSPCPSDDAEPLIFTPIECDPVDISSPEKTIEQEGGEEPSLCMDLSPYTSMASTSPAVTNPTTKDLSDVEGTTAEGNTGLTDHYSDVGELAAKVADEGIARSPEDSKATSSSKEANAMPPRGLKDDLFEDIFMNEELPAMRGDEFASFVDEKEDSLVYSPSHPTSMPDSPVQQKDSPVDETSVVITMPTVQVADQQTSTQPMDPVIPKAKEKLPFMMDSDDSDIEYQLEKSAEEKLRMQQQQQQRDLEIKATTIPLLFDSNPPKEEKVDLEIDMGNDGIAPEIEIADNSLSMDKDSSDDMVLSPIADGFDLPLLSNSVDDDNAASSLSIMEPFKELMEKKIHRQEKRDKRKKNENTPSVKKETKLVNFLLRQAKVEEEMKSYLKVYYRKHEITKDEYKWILKKAVPQVTTSRSAIIPEKIQSLMKKYVCKVKGQRKKTNR